MALQLYGALTAKLIEYQERDVHVGHAQEAWDADRAGALLAAFLEQCGRGMLFMRALRAVRLARWEPGAAAATPLRQVGGVPPSCCCMHAVLPHADTISPPDRLQQHALQPCM
jgi:hypothetical protein